MKGIKTSTVVWNFCIVFFSSVVVYVVVEIMKCVCTIFVV